MASAANLNDVQPDGFFTRLLADASVVARILMIQKPSVTAGTLVSASDRNSSRIIRPLPTSAIKLGSGS